MKQVLKRKGVLALGVGGTEALAFKDMKHEVPAMPVAVQHS